jgi:hypothetical protein
VVVEYIPSVDVFSTPMHSWNGSSLNAPTDSFAYYVEGADDASQRGATVTIVINVVNVNDETNVTCATSTVEAANSEIVQLEGFMLNDVDRGVDIVRAAVRANHGYMTLNQAYVHLLDFTSSEYCFAQQGWYCVGDGRDDTSMVFLGTPHDIQLALNGLQYVGTSNFDSIIDVFVYDGADGQCISSGKFIATSIRDACFVHNCKISVPYKSPESGLGGRGGASGSNNSTIATMIWGGVLTILIAFIFRCCCLQFEWRRK